MTRKAKIIISAASMLLFNMIVISSSALAWFLSVRIEDAETDKFGVRSSDDFTITNTSVLYYDQTSKTGKLASGSSAINLDPYDMLITSNNEKLARYLILEIYFTESFTASSKMKIDIDIDVPSGSTAASTYIETKNSKSYVAKKTSNISQYKFNFISTAPSGDYTTLYNSYKSTFDAKTTYYTFVSDSSLSTVSSVSATKKSQIESIITFPQAFAEGSKGYFIVQLDYNVKLTTFFSLNYYGANPEAAETFVATKSVGTTNDIKLITLEIPSKT